MVLSAVFTKSPFGFTNYAVAAQHIGHVAFTVYPRGDEAQPLTIAACHFHLIPEAHVALDHVVRHADVV
jgi:hypothetical protein